MVSFLYIMLWTIIEQYNLARLSVKNRPIKDYWMAVVFAEIKVHPLKIKFEKSFANFKWF